MTDLIDDVERE